MADRQERESVLCNADDEERMRLVQAFGGVSEFERSMLCTFWNSIVETWLDDVDRHPEKGITLDRLLNLPTDDELRREREEAAVDAAKDSAESARSSAGSSKRSADAAERSAGSSERAVRWSRAAVIVSIIALTVSAFVAFRSSPTQPALPVEPSPQTAPAVP